MTSPEHATPHDALFKAVFSDTENAFALLRPALPRDLVRALDLGSLRLEPASFVDEELREVHRDLLFSAKLEEREVLLYVLVEHQSTPDALMPLRMLRYVVRVWEAWLRKHPGARRVPPVIPVVVHQGPGRWTGPIRLSELIDIPHHLADALGRRLPELELAFHDLGSASVEALASLDGPAAARLTLVLMKSAADDADLVGALERWAELVRELVASPRGQESLAMLLRYTLFVRPIDPATMVGRIKRAIGSEAGHMAKMAADILMERGIRHVLERQLRVRFGEVDAGTLTRLETAGRADLERWADRVISAKKLADVFAAPRKPRPRRRG
jgi:hypothetical protein